MNLCLKTREPRAIAPTDRCGLPVETKRRVTVIGQHDTSLAGLISKWMLTLSTGVSGLVKRVPHSVQTLPGTDDTSQPTGGTDGGAAYRYLPSVDSDSSVYVL